MNFHYFTILQNVVGSEYCGLGNSSGDLRRFVVFEKTEKCCEHHDECESIESGETKHGISNTGKFAMRHCDCVHKFKDCLLTANTWLSHEIGKVYFGVWTDRVCFDVTPPSEACGEFTFVGGELRCSDPVFQRGKPATYRVFPVPFYIRPEDDTEGMHHQPILEASYRKTEDGHLIRIDIPIDIAEQ